MNRYTQIFAKLAEKYSEVSEERLQEVFEEGYRKMTQFLEELEAERSIITAAAFDWRSVFNYDVEAEQVAFYYGLQASSRIEYLLLKLEEWEVDYEINLINTAVIDNINFTPKFKEIVNIAKQDREKHYNNPDFDPVAVHPWLDQRNSPATRIYFDIFGSDNL